MSTIIKLLSGMLFNNLCSKIRLNHSQIMVVNHYRNSHLSLVMIRKKIKKKNC